MLIYLYNIVRIMGKITIDIDDKLERRLRVKIAKSGGRKGDLVKAIESGIEMWVQDPPFQSSNIGDDAGNHKPAPPKIKNR